MCFLLMGLIWTIAGCEKAATDQNEVSQAPPTSLFVYVPDHPQFNPGGFRIGDDGINAATFESELRKKLSSRLYNKIELASGKAGNDHFEGLVMKMATQYRITVDCVPPPRSSR